MFTVVHTAPTATLDKHTISVLILEYVDMRYRIEIKLRLWFPPPTPTPAAFPVYLDPTVLVVLVFTVHTHFQQPPTITKRPSVDVHMEVDSGRGTSMPFSVSTWALPVQYIPQHVLYGIQCNPMCGEVLHTYTQYTE